MLNTKRPTLRARAFFSLEFTLELELYPHGGLEGIIRPFNQIPGYHLELGGVYVREESLIKLSFFSSNDSAENLLSNDSIFSGYLIDYEENKSCLFLRKFEALKLYNLDAHVYVDEHLVLFDRPVTNPSNEVKRVPFLNEVREFM